MAGENKQREDEVGWLFVQEYYTMMNRTPQKLHLFYKKNSTFVHGVEGESSKLSQGQREILTKVQELNFKDCKVLVSNVDSQASFDNTILIQVLGEMSNNGQDSRKFAQTFLLAPQEFGYYVHNDIFRFLKEEVDESDFGDEQGHAAPNTHEETLFSHEVASTQQVPPPTQIQTPHTNGTTTAPAESEAKKPLAEKSVVADEVVASPTQTPVADPSANRSEAVETIANPPVSAGSSATESAPSQPTTLSQETPATAIPATAATTHDASLKAEPQQPAEPVKPAAPLSWAARAAANAAKTATAAVVNKVTPAVTPASAPAQKKQSAPAQPEQQQQAQQVQSAQPSQQPQQQQSGSETSKSAFLKSLTPSMSDESIRRELGKHGAFKTVEINRAKKCGFVDYLSAGACASAIKQHLHDIDGEMLQVEERRKDVNTGKGPYGGKKFDKAGRGSPATRGGSGAGRGQGTPRTQTPTAK